MKDYIGWIAAVLSIIGIILNAYMNIYCWAFWIAADIFWIIWAIKADNKPQIVLWIVFTIANLYGWYKWL